MANRHMKRYSTLLSVRVMQIKIIIIAPLRTAIIKYIYIQTINAREDVGKREPSFAVGGNVNWYSYYAEQYGGSLKN